MAGRYNASAQGGNQPGKVNNARLPDVEAFLAAGIDPKTGLPIKFVMDTAEGFKPHNKKLLKIIDEQDAINRYKWFNLPDGLNSQLIERVLYYKGQGMFFYIRDVKKFFFLPYAMADGIDVYGRFTRATPLPFNGSTKPEDAKKPWIDGLSRKCVYDVYIDELTVDVLTDSCVLLQDYCLGISQINIPRETLNDPLLDVMADCIPFMRTALLNSTGVEGMRVSNEDDQSNVEAASRSIDRAALTGRKFIPVIGSIEFQEMTGGSVSKSEEFMLAMQSLDNYRLSTYGIKNGGLFQKKQHLLQTEADVAGVSNSAMDDGIYQRIEFCDIVNSIWGLGIWCEIAEPQIQVDRNMDGEASENGMSAPSNIGGETDVSDTE